MTVAVDKRSGRVLGQVLKTNSNGNGGGWVQILTRRGARIVSERDVRLEEA